MFGDKNDRRSKFGKFKAKKLTKPESELEYKNVEYLARLIGPTGKLMSRRRTGFDGQNQRKLANAVKVARFMSLLPYTGANPNDPREQRDFRDARDARDARDSRGRDHRGPRGGQGEASRSPAGAAADATAAKTKPDGEN